MKRLLRLGTLLAVAALPLPALASPSIALGGLVQTPPENTAGAMILSSGQSIPKVPLEVQASALVPFARGSGYAVTGEVRGFTGGGYGGAYVGAGAGFGNLSDSRTAGSVFTVFGGKAIAPLTSIELRFYTQTGSSGGSGGFAGLRFSF